MLTDLIGHLLSSCTLFLLLVAWRLTPLRFNAFWLNSKRSKRDIQMTLFDSKWDELQGTNTAMTYGGLTDHEPNRTRMFCLGHGIWQKLFVYGLNTGLQLLCCQLVCAGYCPHRGSGGKRKSPSCAVWIDAWKWLSRKDEMSSRNTWCSLSFFHKKFASPWAVALERSQQPRVNTRVPRRTLLQHSTVDWWMLYPFRGLVPWQLRCHIEDPDELQLGCIRYKMRDGCGMAGYGRAWSLYQRYSATLVEVMTASLYFLGVANGRLAADSSRTRFWQYPIFCAALQCEFNMFNVHWTRLLLWFLQLPGRTALSIPWICVPLSGAAFTPLG